MQLSLDHKRLDVVLIFSLTLMLVMPVLMPECRLLFLAPFLVIACYKNSLHICLWMALLCGLFYDLLSTNDYFGLHALTYCLTVLVVHPLRQNFFPDNLSTLPLMTFFFSALSTIIMALIQYAVGAKEIFSEAWVLTDVIFMPVLDSAYAFCCFILPALLFGRPRRRGKDYFF